MQNNGAEIVSDEPTHGELPLSLVALNGRVQIGRVVCDRAYLPFTKRLCRREVDVHEVWIATLQCEWDRARRYLRPIRDTVAFNAPDDVGGQVPAVLIVGEGEALIK